MPERTGSAFRIGGLGVSVLNCGGGDRADRCRTIASGLSGLLSVCAGEAGHRRRLVAHPVVRQQIVKAHIEDTPGTGMLRLLFRFEG
jgi:hypothetical protein